MARGATHQARVVSGDGATLVHIARGGKTAGPNLPPRAPAAPPVLESAAPTVNETGSKTPPAGDAPAGGPPGPPDEFAGIPSRASRHPAIAAAAILLAGFLVFQMRADVRYALSPTVAVDLGDARKLVAAGQVPANRYVRLSGLPDRESALILDTQGSWSFRQFFRLLGTGDRVFIKRAADPLPVDLAERDVFTGRLVPFQDLSFQESIRRHFSANVSATHFFEPAALEAALGKSGGVALVDRLGQSVSLAPDDRLAIDVGRPGDFRIELPGDRWNDLEKAKATVVQRGGQIVEATSTETKRRAVVARFPDERREAALTALSDLDRRVRITQATSTLQVRLGELRVGEAGLVARTPQGEVALPRDRIESVRAVAPVRIPEGAWLLVEGERPRDHLRAVVIAVLLVGFALFNALALRPRRRA